jgi:hypothetical protein
MTNLPQILGMEHLEMREQAADINFIKKNIRNLNFHKKKRILEFFKYTYIYIINKI